MLSYTHQLNEGLLPEFKNLTTIIKEEKFMARITLTKPADEAQAQAPVQETVSKEVATAAVNAQAPVDENIDSETLGSKSDKIEFIAALGDPSRDDVTPANLEKGIERRVDPTIVGYAFKVLEDMEVPECGTDDDLKDNPMSYKDKDGKRMAKAGETIYLTRFETGMLLSQPEFNTRITGGNMPVSVSYTFFGKPKDGKLPTVTSQTRIPSVTLRPSQVGQSIKDIKMIPVLSYTVEKDDRGRTRKKRTINQGFEKWAPLCKERTVAARARSAVSQKAVRNNKAAAFLQIVASKKN